MRLLCVTVCEIKKNTLRKCLCCFKKIQQYHGFSVTFSDTSFNFIAVISLKAGFNSGRVFLHFGREPFYIISKLYYF